MDYKQAADILDPATSREALLPYAYDPQYQQMLLRDACQVAAQVLRSATGTNVGDKWVSVKDDPPKESGEYIVGCNRPGEGMVDTSFWFADRKEWALFGELVTHWMPMPELPKGEV